MIAFLKKIWGWVRIDGLLHIETSAMIVLAIDAMCPWWIGNIVSATAGIGKEIWDQIHDGSAEWHDIICDAIGIILADIIILLKNLIK